MADDETFRELQACEQIRRLAADYAHGVDKRDRERFVSVWHDDAAWQPLPDADWLNGHDAILSALEGMWSGLTETHHWMANHSIRVNGASATGIVDADCVVQTPDGSWFRVAATYHDDYERRGDEWKLARRTTEVSHNLPIAEAPAAG